MNYRSPLWENAGIRIDFAALGSSATEFRHTIDLWPDSSGRRLRDSIRPEDEAYSVRVCTCSIGWWHIGQGRYSTWGVQYGICSCDVLWVNKPVSSQLADLLINEARARGYLTPVERGLVPGRNVLRDLARLARQHAKNQCGEMYDIVMQLANELRDLAELRPVVHKLPHLFATPDGSTFELNRHGELLACYPTGFTAVEAQELGAPTIFAPWPSATNNREQQP